jgi:hypothetical protein
VGRKNGLAQRLSKVLHCIAYAPKGIKSALGGIKISIENGRLVFEPLYDVNKDEEYLAPHIYESGLKK